MGAHSTSRARPAGGGAELPPGAARRVLRLPPPRGRSCGPFRAPRAPFSSGGCSPVPCPVCSYKVTGKEAGVYQHPAATVTYKPAEEEAEQVRTATPPQAPPLAMHGASTRSSAPGAAPPAACPLLARLVLPLCAAPAPACLRPWSYACGADVDTRLDALLPWRAQRLPRWHNPARPSAGCRPRVQTATSQVLVFRTFTIGQTVTIKARGRAAVPCVAVLFLHSLLESRAPSSGHAARWHGRWDSRRPAAQTLQLGPGHMQPHTKVANGTIHLLRSPVSRRSCSWGRACRAAT